jgi:hypothetical protein
VVSDRHNWDLRSDCKRQGNGERYQKLSEGEWFHDSMESGEMRQALHAKGLLVRGDTVATSDGTQVREVDKLNGWCHWPRACSPNPLLLSRRELEVTWLLSGNRRCQIFCCATL